MFKLRNLIILGLFLCSAVALAKKTEKKEESPFQQLELFNKIIHLVETQYYRDVDTRKLIEGAINGMLNTLDPHSAFLDKEVFEKMQEDTAGEFGGLGIEVTTKDGMIYVITPIDDTPAFEAGIKAGDLIVEIDHTSTLGLTLQDAVEKMRGKPGSKILLGVKRKGKDSLVHIEIKRQIIKTKPVKFELIDDYAYVRLTQFQRRSAESIVEALKSMRQKAGKKGIKGILLDLRFNPGGLLDEAVEVSSIFLKDGVVVSTEGRDPNQKEIRYVNKSIYKELDLPVGVLINGASASASEIVAGALQDHKRAIIMGTRSFGKGSVQTVARIDKENGVKLTIAQYMTPSGRKIQAIGIDPDVEIKYYKGIDLDEYEEDHFIREKDLKNHLVATIETKEEKKQREEDENVLRERRKDIIRKHKNKKDKEGEEEEALYTRYEPKKDFMVVEGIKFLQALSFSKQLK